MLASARCWWSGFPWWVVLVYTLLHFRTPACTHMYARCATWGYPCLESICLGQYTSDRYYHSLVFYEYPGAQQRKQHQA